MKSFKEFIAEESPYGNKLFDPQLGSSSKPEANTPEEQKVLDALISFWEANRPFPKKYMSDLRAMKADPNFKHVTEPNGSEFYRGMSIPRDELHRVKWKKKSGKGHFFDSEYVGEYKFTPRTELTSFTLDKDVARRYAGYDREGEVLPTIIMSKDKSDFIFKSTDIQVLSFYGGFDVEVDYMKSSKKLKCTIHISEDTYDSLMNGMD